MRKTLPLLLALVTSLFSTTAFAQQDMQFTQYMFTGLYFNPATAGINNFASAQVAYRNQYFNYSETRPTGGLSGNQQQQFISFNAPIKLINSGVGFHILRDQLGPMTNIDFQLSLAHHIKIGDGKLSLGARGGMLSRTLDTRDLRAFDDSDPNLPRFTETATAIDFAAGVQYTTEKFYVGVSMTRLGEPEFDLRGVSTLQAVRNLYITGGLALPLNETFVLTPSALIQSDFNYHKLDIGTLLTFENRLFGGFNFRSGLAQFAEVSSSGTSQISNNVTSYTVSDIGLILGFNFLKDNSMRLSYSFDAVLPNADALSPTSHEIHLSYNIPNFSATPRPVIRTPRYRR